MMLFISLNSNIKLEIETTALRNRILMAMALYREDPAPPSRKRDSALQQWWRAIAGRWRETPVTDAAGLRHYITEHSAYIAQKCATEYCRGKAGSFGQDLFREQPFLDLLAICRWETYVAALGDVLTLFERFLRPHTKTEEEAQLLKLKLTKFYAAIISTYPPPVHRPEGWGPAIEAFETRMASALPHQAANPADLCMLTVKRLNGTLPIHKNLRLDDFEVVRGLVRFQFIWLWDKSRRLVRGPEVVRDLLAHPV